MFQTGAVMFVVLAGTTLNAAPVPLATQASSSVAGKTPSLYQRLGGYDVLARIVDDWFARQGKDPLFARFAPATPQRARWARQQTLDFLCEQTGGPCFYTGADMKSAHQGMKIDPALWDALEKYLDQALRVSGVPAAESSELVAVVARFKSAIVEQPAP